MAEPTNPATLRLPYKTGAAWAEREILAGRCAPRVHHVDVEIDALPDMLQDRARDLQDRIWFNDDIPFGSPEPYLHDTGIDDSYSSLRMNGEDVPDFEYLHSPITSTIGLIPEIPEPTDDPVLVLAAWQAWADRYKQLAPGALQAWATRWKEEDPTFRSASGIGESAWLVNVGYLNPRGQTTSVKVDATEDPIDIFQRLKASIIRRRVTSTRVEEPDLMVARDVVGTICSWDPRLGDLSDFAEAFAAHSERFCNLALANHQARTRNRYDFEHEMKQWAAAQGSSRLKIGIEDGYRMIGTYLEERIIEEMPGGYAMPLKDTDKLYGTRTAPTELALLLRRAVQKKLDANPCRGLAAAKATIVWMKDLPDALEDTVDGSGTYIGRQVDEYEPERWREFEAIIVRGWLGRYLLVGPVNSDEVPLPVMVNRCLLPSEYGIEGPHWVAPSQRGRGDFVPRPVDMGDFAPAPAPSGSTADDDIPF